MSLTLEDIYDYLATGELAQVVMGSPADSNVLAAPKTKYKQLRSAVQLGLTDLHKRFLIREGTLIVSTVNGPGVYQLTTEFAQSNPRANPLTTYILDTSSPFRDDLLKIARIYDDQDVELDLNILDDETSILTPTNTSLILPSGSTATQLRVVYHANHPVINKTLADSAPSVVKIELDYAYLHALTLFVASRIMNPIGLSGDTFHEGNNYFSKYLLAIQDLGAQGIAISRTSASEGRVDKGWV